MKKNKKFIFITGGVSSSLGKGLTAACIASLIERRGIKINLLKMDPYINVDPGTMSPTQHGEVFVTDDGAETDLDLGHYERFTNLTLNRDNNFTSGQVYLNIIENEREGKYLGKTVQVVPHITDEIKRRIHKAAEGHDILLGEIGGTVGDIESGPFMEAIRQLILDVGSENVLLIHLVLIPYLNAANELKSKPAQHSVKELRSIGLVPQIIICRADRDISEEIIGKISLFCNVAKDHVFKAIDADSIYKVPLDFNQQGLDHKIIERLGIWAKDPDISDLKTIVDHIENASEKVRVGIVGKYTDLTESYKSLHEALVHGAIANKVKLDIRYIDATKLESQNSVIIDDVDCILVPGGFGERGTEGKIKAIQYARENKIPFFGICLGMQLAAIEYARNVAKIPRANSEEFSTADELVIHFMKGQKADIAKGGSMRLGAYDCELVPGSLADKIYGETKISERHRHRLEFNNAFKEKLSASGMVISGSNPQLDLVEVIELENHPFYIACQYHPEFKSKLFKPHPLFKAFITAAQNFRGEE